MHSPDVARMGGPRAGRARMRLVPILEPWPDPTIRQETRLAAEPPFRRAPGLRNPSPWRTSHHLGWGKIPTQALQTRTTPCAPFCPHASLIKLILSRPGLRHIHPTAQDLHTAATRQRHCLAASPSHPQSIHYLCLWQTSDTPQAAQAAARAARCWVRGRATAGSTALALHVVQALPAGRGMHARARPHAGRFPHGRARQLRQAPPDAHLRRHACASAMPTGACQPQKVPSVKYSTQSKQTALLLWATSKVPKPLAFTNLQTMTHQMSAPVTAVAAKKARGSLL